MTMLRAGEQAPAFELPDLAGRRHSLARALEGGLALVVFWKSTCGTCHLAFPYLQRLAEAYPQATERLLAVSQDAKGSSAAFASKYGLTFPVLIEGEGWPASNLYDPDATPTLFLVGPGGAIALASVGFEKEVLNEIAARVAASLGQPAQVIAQEDDGNPRFKPG